MKIDFFITLQKAIDTGSFAMAAKAVHVTPSAVSMQMKSLERYFGKALFHRSGQHVRPTRFALELSDRIRPTVDCLLEMKGGDRDALGGCVALGVVRMMQPSVLPTLYRTLRDRGHDILIRCVPGRSRDLIEAVKTGEIGAAVVAEPDGARRKQLSWRLIREEPFYLMTPCGVRYGGNRARLRELDWVGYDRDTVLGRLSRKIAGDYFQAAAPTLELQSPQAISAMVAAGFGAAVMILPGEDPRRLKGVDVHRLPDTAPVVRFSLLTRKADRRDPVLDEVARCILPCSPPPA
ncbi:LysR family transcriptional regulator [Alloalcanivorax marinus]|uniref:LysR family transcriptional regulator n=1 Tax=Alloalcanivorax marinus TaxID=1177169 RepID=UPI001932A26B|nr:LysR family transcriptional regulator [Alloalcanivorax marinus]MBL7250506.1 LysR family transcriptional regulator [Alloalcanivorax marinus]